MNRIAIVLVLFLPACSLFSPEDNTAEKAPMGVYEASFSTLNWQIGDTLSLPSFQFGLEPEEMGLDSNQLIPANELTEMIPIPVLEQADFDTNTRYYPMGAIAFGDGKRAYLVGAYEDFHAFHTQLFLFDSLEEKFTYTQSLNYLIGGGNFLSLRKAWLLDLNQDAMPDLVYRKDELYNSPEPDLSYYLDTLRAEIWDGKAYQTFPIDRDPYVKAVFAMDE